MGVARLIAFADGRLSHLWTVSRNLSTPTPTPPHKGEGKLKCRTPRGRALAMLRGKTVEMPGRKHDNLPV